MAQKPTSTGLINLGDWLRANQQSADALGTRLASGADSELTDAEQAIADAGSDFKNRATQYAGADLPVQPNANDFGPLETRDWGAFRKAMADYKTKLEEATSRTYKGPQELGELETLADVQAKASRAVSRGAGLGSENGRVDQLEQLYGRPEYGSGLKAADAFLAGASTGGQKAVSNTQARLSRLQNYLSQASDKAKTDAKEAEKLVETRAQDAKSRLDVLNAPPPVVRSEIPDPNRLRGPQYKQDELEWRRNRARGGDKYKIDAEIP